ncbi:glycosyltransferase [Actinomadura parmotrematis]|uniref:Glycosyl transferase family 28 C-terminal domain-containing protein n=1 Tax=Actinomadura parmotrematis TaxID=2864039 RepID=A0ABS7G2P5_9ACTN|nr:glycosyltransferase [Actinomadura parmotrematis]MBW8486995.1 hypothetical protein [Actinomadura parmotrematis]
MIGYYVHHQGRGHLHRALCVARHLGAGVTALSSLPRPAGWPGAWVALPRDDVPEAAGDTTANGRLHWAPHHHPGLRGRMAAVARWIEAAAPAVLVADVSVEVALLARLLGVPTIVAAMRGDRGDPAHRLAYDAADGLLAPWPAHLPEPGWPAAWTAKTCHTGAFSRFDGRPRPAPPARTRRRAVLLAGAGGGGPTSAQVCRARRAAPGWDFAALGGPGPWCGDPWPVLCAADVVVTHAGQNAVAECAAAARPAVVIPQDRPHGEQRATAAALRGAGLADVRDRWPEPAEWPGLLDAAAGRDGARWREWAPGDGAARAAAFVREVAARHDAREAAPCAPL